MTPQGGDQVIPRPAGAVPGGDAPWARLPVAVRRGIGLDRVTAAVSGLVEHGSVAASVPPPPLVDGDPAEAAVLVAVFEEGGESRVVLTRRAAHMRSHRHEVSFPGGRLEPGERPEEGARREAAEEVGLDPALAVTVGRLSPLVTVSSMHWMIPVVAWLPARPRLTPNPAEVARVFDVALADLAADGVFREERWPVWARGPARGVPRGSSPAADGVAVDPAGRLAPPEVKGTYPVWFFELAGETIWGATARVLYELLMLVLVGPAGGTPV